MRISKKVSRRDPLQPTQLVTAKLGFSRISIIASDISRDVCPHPNMGADLSLNVYFLSETRVFVPEGDWMKSCPQ